LGSFGRALCVQMGDTYSLPRSPCLFVLFHVWAFLVENCVTVCLCVFMYVYIIHTHPPPPSPLPPYTQATNTHVAPVGVGLLGLPVGGANFDGIMEVCDVTRSCVT
jgi:hypothetical protein